MIAPIESHIEKYIQDYGVLQNPSKEVIRLIKKYVRLSLHRNTLSPYMTGLVFCGYGSSQWYPSLIHFGIDGVVSGRLKANSPTRDNVDQFQRTAIIKSFAQSEMATRFLDGVDPDYDQYIDEWLSTAMREYNRELIRTLNVPVNMRQPVSRALNQAAGKLAQTFKHERRKFRAEQFRSGIDQMVAVMPKEEIATLAESLVDLTSLKRRVSNESETVGGDIDVAVITRSEGLVWIKRKHYFSTELNPRYLARNYGKLPMQGV